MSVSRTKRSLSKCAFKAAISWSRMRIVRSRNEFLGSAAASCLSNSSIIRSSFFLNEPQSSLIERGTADGDSQEIGVLCLFAGIVEAAADYVSVR